MKRSEHIAGFVLGLVLVILGGRALAYAATPTPLAGSARRPAASGDHVRRACAGHCASRSACSGSPRWACASATRSIPLRARRLASRSRASPRTPRCSRGGSLLGFAALETWLHSRAGMHMHWWMCLEGPVHRNAIPILLALSLAAAALLGALRHALAWARRVVARPAATAAAARRHDGRSRSPSAHAGHPAVAARTRRCAPAGRPRSPSRSHHATRGRTT